MVVVQHLRAPNNTAGNPRRLWMFVKVDGDTRKVVHADEGYSGRNWALDTRLNDVIELPAVDITPQHYRNVVTSKFTTVVDANYSEDIVTALG